MRDHREEIIAVTHALDDAGMVPNKSGNVSCRVADGFAITPAGIPYRELVPSHIVTLPLDAPVVAMEPRPSSEWRMHAAIYRARPDVLAIVHTHSPRATALAAAGRGIPPFHYMIALVGGDVRCMPYATFGTAELAESAVRGLQDRRACLLGNHGVMAIGSTLARAHAVAVEVENLAGEYLSMLSAGLVPQLLDDAEIQKVVGHVHRLRPVGLSCAPQAQPAAGELAAEVSGDEEREHAPAERQSEREPQRDHHRHGRMHRHEPLRRKLAHTCPPVTERHVDDERDADGNQVGDGVSHACGSVSFA